MKESTTTVASTTAYETAKPDQGDQTKFTEDIKSLILETRQLKERAVKVGHKLYVSQLDKYLRTLAHLMKLVQRPSFDAAKVRQVIDAVKSRLDKIRSDLDRVVTTEMMKETSESTSTAAATEVCNFTLFLNRFCS